MIQDTKTFAKPSPLSWAQYLAESPQTSLKNSEMGVQKMERMCQLFQSWRRKQIARAHQTHNQQFISPPPVTSLTSDAVTTPSMTTVTSVTLDRCMKRMLSLSLCDLQVLQETPWGPSWEFCQLAHRGRSQSVGMLPTLVVTYKSRGTTSTKKTTKMPHQFHEYAKLPKGWAMAEVKNDEVEEVWQKQKKALSNSTTHGVHTQLQSRLTDMPSPQCPMDSSPI